MTTSEERLSQQIAEYQKLAKEDPKIDVNALMVQALAQAQAEERKKPSRWAYLIALCFPPFGLIYSVQYFFTDDESKKQRAVICAVLTIISVLAMYFMIKVMFSSAGVNPSQLQQIRPTDINSLYQ